MVARERWKRDKRMYPEKWQRFSALSVIIIIIPNSEFERNEKKIMIASCKSSLYEPVRNTCYFHAFFRKTLAIDDIPVNRYESQRRRCRE